MKELTKKELRKLQLTELDILKEFDCICRKHNIKYSLDGGTLIGAIRHNGFIPWDDDIDVIMLRKDYDKFLEVQKKEIDDKKYYVDSMETNDNNWTLYAKMKRKNSLYTDITSNRPKEEQHIWIDLFPIDKIPNNKLLSKLHYLRVYILKIILMYKNNYITSSNDKKKDKLVKYIKIISKFYNSNRLKKRLNKYIRKYNNKKCECCACYAGVYLGKEILDKDIYDNGVIEHKFEDKNYYVLKEYDRLLTHFYGDYMKLPKKEDRVGHHYTDEIKFP